MFSSGPSDRLVGSGVPAPLVSGQGLAGSQDSLSSTGSNHELKVELASSLAEVRAAVSDVVEKVSPDLVVADDLVMELVGRPAGSREGVGRKLSQPDEVEMRRKVGHETGARPRSIQTSAPRNRVRSEQEGVLLKQSSWGSREPLAATEDRTQAKSFMKNKELWEKRGGSSPSSDEVSSWMLLSTNLTIVGFYLSPIKVRNQTKAEHCGQRL